MANILIAGPAGAGKSELARDLLREANGTYDPSRLYLARNRLVGARTRSRRQVPR